MACVKAMQAMASACTAAVVRMLGLDSDAAGFERQFARDPMLGSLIGAQRGLRIPLTPTPWEALAWAIIGQQISLRFAVALRRELIAAAGVLHASGLRAHPSATTVAAMNVDALRSVKFSGSKAEYLLEAARAVTKGDLSLDAMREMSVSRAAQNAGRGAWHWPLDNPVFVSPGHRFPRLSSRRRCGPGTGPGPAHGHTAR